MLLCIGLSASWTTVDSIEAKTPGPHRKNETIYMPWIIETGKKTIAPGKPAGNPILWIRAITVPYTKGESTKKH